MGAALFDEVTERRQASPARLWSGAWELRELAVARPFVVARAENELVVGCLGTLAESSLHRLATLIASCVDGPAVWLMLASPTGELAGLRAAAGAIRRHGRVVAHVQVACGPALYLAASCGLVVSTPAATIGQIRCAVDPTVFTTRPEEPVEAPSLTERMGAQLAEAKPGVSHETWMSLARHTANGERAEQLGIVDLVRRDLWGDRILEQIGATDD